MNLFLLKKKYIWKCKNEFRNNFLFRKILELISVYYCLCIRCLISQCKCPYWTESNILISLGFELGNT